MPRDDWVFDLGQVTNRDEIVSLYGGSVYSGGIVTSKTTTTIMLFTDPEQGEGFGYNFDGVRKDRRGFDYTGAGRVGDQQEVRGNRAVIHHKSEGRTLHLFEAVGTVGETAAKAQQYVGEFVLDDADPFRREIAADQEGKTRSVYVFHLVPVGETILQDLAAKNEIALGPATEPNARAVPLEVDSTLLFDVSATEPGMARKTEASLVDEFVSTHAQRAGRFHRWAIRVPGDKQSLLTDLYDSHQRILYEAKGGARRADVRAAIAQLFDYRRHVDVPGLRCSVLLPERPSDDLIALIQTCGLGLTIHEDGRFNQILG